MTYDKHNLGFIPTAEQARKIESVHQITGKSIRECALALVSEEWVMEDAVYDLCNDQIASGCTSPGQQATLRQELAAYGEVRNRGCVLKTDGSSYLMYASRNISIKHSLACSCTDDARLEAHWAGFVANQNAVWTTPKAAFRGLVRA